MRLKHAPFMAIKSGRKKIEMRLQDEKRALIKEGDSVEFTDVETLETILCKVVRLHCYKSFDELYAQHDKISLGYQENEEAIPTDMLAYYPQEEVRKYSVVGIEIALI